MKKLIFLLLLLSGQIFSQSSKELAPVATEQYKGYTISIFKEEAAHRPYVMTISGNKAKTRNLQIISNVDQFTDGGKKKLEKRFVVTEEKQVDKMGFELYTYPINWKSLELITIDEIKAACHKLIDKKVKYSDVVFLNAASKAE